MNNNFIAEKIYNCKANDEEGPDIACSCKEQNENGDHNCTCFADEVPTNESTYLDCFDALKKGKLESGVYFLKPDNMAPFKVYTEHCIKHETMLAPLFF